MSDTFKGFEKGIPPMSWTRILSMDVGGATPNNLEWAAVDPESQSIVFYDEVNITTTDMREVAMLALPKMKHPSDQEYTFLAKVGDYENRIALDDMSKYGIRFTNAVKHDKAISIRRLAGYLHPNPKRPFPAWHPKAGRLGAPLMYIVGSRCPVLVKELPVQKWKQTDKSDSETRKDEMDKSIRHDAVDCALYIARIMPAPINIPIPKVEVKENDISLQSKLYWIDVKRREKALAEAGIHKPYNPSHIGGSAWQLPL